MNTGVSLVPPRRILVLLILLASLVAWIPGQRRLAQTRQALGEARKQAAALEERIATATTTLESVRHDLREAKAKHNQVMAALTKTEQELAQNDPDAPWIAPPPRGPEWIADSPYVWVHKGILRELPFPTFGKNGTLTSEIAGVLAMDEASRLTLNKELGRLTAGYHALETANAQRIENHLPLPNVLGDDAPKVTVRMPAMPEEGQRLQEQFNATLRNCLGEQRADVLMGTGASWIDSEFSAFGVEPKTISIGKRSDGAYEFSIESGKGTRMSCSGPSPMWVASYLPPHLRSFFTQVLDDGSASDAADPAR